LQNEQYWGKTRIEAAATVGVNRRFVGQWVKAAAQSGEAALAGGCRGRRPGEQKALSAGQEEGLRDLIARGCPDQYGLSFALWTRHAVRALIARESGVWLSLSVVGNDLPPEKWTPSYAVFRSACSGVM
jgi:transposase